MKSIFIFILLFVSAQAFAAKVKDAKCSDLAMMNEKVTPEYLAVIDGYDNSGKKVSEEVDMAGIVTESKEVNQHCATNKSAAIKDVRKQLHAKKTMPSTAAKLNPTKAKCQDFVALGEEVQPVAAFWVAGHDKSGKLVEGEVDEAFLDRPILSLVEDCKANPRASFYDRAKAWVDRRL